MARNQTFCRMPGLPRGPERGVGVTLRRSTLWCAALLVCPLVAWTAATAWYIASRDEIAQRVFVRETETRFAYEDRIGRLSQRLEREVTQNMVERTGFEARVAAIAARQEEIEARQAWLRSAAERVAPGSTGPAHLAGRAAAPAPDVLGTGAIDPKAAPGATGAGPRDRSSGEERPRLRDKLSAMETSLEQLAAEERYLVGAVGGAARIRLSKVRSALSATGLNFSHAGPQDAVGGPLVALPKPPGGRFDGLLADLDVSIAELGRLTSTAKALPLAAPLSGELDPTSPFGYRVDPFTRGPALHTGVDFRTDLGSAARATAAGRVTIAEYTGGYGNLVEIDHGSGVATRYGHLSAFAVVPGERVEAGQIVGRTGSTGRSTGPHLHYETRINGDPVNPIRFLEAGRRLTGQDG